MRRLLLGLGVVVLIVVAAGAWLLSDLSRFIPRIEAAASRPLARTVHIGGLRLRPDFSVEARDVTVANLPGGTRPDMLTLPRVTARIGLAGLFGGTVDIRDITLEQPDLLLERDNWLFQPPRPTGGPSAPSSAPTFRAVLHRVTIVDGRLTSGGQEYRLPTAQATLDGANGDGAARLLPPTGWLADWLADWPANSPANSPSGPIDVSAHGGADPTHLVVTRGAQRVTLDTAPLAALRSPADGVRPFDVTVEQPGSTAHAKGSAGPAAFDATFDARSANLAALTPLFPAGAGSAAGHAHATFAAGAKPTGTVAFDHLALAGPAGDLAGDLELSNVGLPSARGVLTSKRLDADTLVAVVRRVLAAQATPPSAPVQPPTPASPTPATAEPAPAVTAAAPRPALLPFGWLREAAGDLTVTADTLLLAGTTFQNAHAHAVLADGRLALDPVVAATDAGAATASLHADGVSVPPTIVLMLQAPSLRLTSGPLTGAASVRADLNAAGATEADLLASLGGSASAALVDGEIDNAVAAPVVRALVAHLPVPLTLTGGTTHVRCAVARASFADGVATAAPLTLDTTRLLATGEGSVDLRARTLAVRLRPVLQAGPGISIPLLVSGGWELPRIGPDAHPLPIPSGDPCGTSLTAIGSALPPPEGLASPPAKRPKPADLLRSLLR